jgi:hypothetical protein
VKYLITLPQMAKSKRNKIYNLNKKIIEVTEKETFPNGITIVQDSKGKTYSVNPFGIEIDNPVTRFPDTWKGSSVYLLYSNKEDAIRMNQLLLRNMINKYSVLRDELNQKIEEIEKLIEN